MAARWVHALGLRGAGGDGDPGPGSSTTVGMWSARTLDPSSSSSCTCTCSTLDSADGALRVAARWVHALGLRGAGETGARGRGTGPRSAGTLDPSSSSSCTCTCSRLDSADGALRVADAPRALGGARGRRGRATLRPRPRARGSTRPTGRFGGRAAARWVHATGPGSPSPITPRFALPPSVSPRGAPCRAPRSPHPPLRAPRSSRAWAPPPPRCEAPRHPSATGPPAPVAVDVGPGLAEVQPR